MDGKSRGNQMWSEYEIGAGAAGLGDNPKTRFDSGWLYVGRLVENLLDMERDAGKQEAFEKMMSGQRPSPTVGPSFIIEETADGNIKLSKEQVSEMIRLANESGHAAGKVEGAKVFTAMAMSRRDHFAAAALGALILEKHNDDTARMLPRSAVNLADALLMELDK